MFGYNIRTSQHRIAIKCTTYQLWKIVTNVPNVPARFGTETSAATLVEWIHLDRRGYQGLA